MSFNINSFSGTLNYIKGDNKGTVHTNNTSTATATELMDALQQLLASPAIPWGNHAELKKLHGELQQALKVGDVSDAGLGATIRKLKNLVSQLAIGVSGNYAYDFLIKHFS